MQKKFFQNLRALAYGLPTLLYVFTTCLAVIVLLAAKHDYDARQVFEGRSADILVVPPESAPELSQESVDIALALFNIQIPAGTKHPTFDPNLQDRGLTTLRGWGSKLEVTVGPAAFESWGLLGSTLAHELEVHCRQSFTLIRALDLLGLDGTLMAEREAYLHELNNAGRFHLGQIERENIQATMDFYYPVQDEDTLSAR
ncbi:hypothetical protein [Pseudobacteriovorax antillogorgiicola]|uniref:Uncharacterized protein n=2 Tax=Pseudobacteriovorax antillogorgiicola TaxID=1513793 RepID=A0A1Y6BU70_9BACT|nr:hypothetical protein [Pseudobacteriovorax antillogorgiicola]TCS53851.1 hypothetical protein EDD56_107160 [Pseudobacteriovorax antillogorgiicola]SMF21571.1 hypothetical protein SAMN06296036_107112 [Pseudobacteriovorax antillogorgiicola]